MPDLNTLQDLREDLSVALRIIVNQQQELEHLRETLRQIVEQRKATDVSVPPTYCGFDPIEEQ